MQRLFAILLLGLLALGSFGLTAGAGAAAPATCAASVAAPDDGADVFAVPAAQVEGPASKNRSTPSVDGPQYACNSGCARNCRQQFGNCQTRQCRQQFNSCVRGCGC